MPLYEYRCKTCGHTFEKIQSFSAPEEKECPVCHGEVERLLSAPAFQFKGSGWYVSDYGGKSKSGTMKASADGDGSSKSSESSPSDKPASSSSDGSSSSSSPAPSTTRSE
ncbi:MAG: zinc ribbon domain-containing protein [Acidobacteriaceae bacterium]